MYQPRRVDSPRPGAPDRAKRTQRTQERSKLQSELQVRCYTWVMGQSINRREALEDALRALQHAQQDILGALIDAWQSDLDMAQFVSANEVAEEEANNADKGGPQ